MNLLIRFIKGMVIGMVSIIPGVCTATICILLGLYEKLVEAVSNLNKHFKDNLIFILPIVLGMGVGILAFSNIISWLLDKHQMVTIYTFGGVIIGTIPMLFRKANSNSFKPHYLIYLTVTLVVGLAFLLLDPSSYSNPTTINLNFMSFFLFFLSGILISTTLILPGLSGSALLLVLGIYGVFIDAIKTMNFTILIPTALGVVIGAISMAKIMDRLLKNYYGQTFYAIIGFVLGTIPAIITMLPSFSLTGIISVFALIASAFVSYNLTKLEE